MQYDTFISYRHADGDAARAVAKLLRAFNLKVFIDDGIAAGAEWAPEIWAALELSKTLMVLWSRNAARSPHVREEWTRASASCNVFALALDGEALPPELGKFNAITGLDVAGRLLARSVELMKSEKLSPAKAQERLLTELAKDGVVLEEKQKRALAGFLPLVSVTSWWLPAWLPTAALLSAGGAATFAAGYLVAPPTLRSIFHASSPAREGTTVVPSTEPTPDTVIPTIASANTCPDCSQETVAQKTCAAELTTCNDAKAGCDAQAAKLGGELKQCKAAAPNAGNPSSKPGSPVPTTSAAPITTRTSSVPSPALTKTTPTARSAANNPVSTAPLATIFSPGLVPTAVAPANTLH